VQNPVGHNANGTFTMSTTHQLVDGAGAAPTAVAAPPISFPPASYPRVTFTGAGGLAWLSPETGTLEYALTDAEGTHAVLVRNDLTGIPGQTQHLGHPVRDVWYDGGRVWFTALTGETAPTDPNGREYLSLFSVDPAQPAVVRAEKPTHALQLDLAGGEAVWLDGTTVHAANLSTGVAHTVPVPGPRGSRCQVPLASAYAQGSFPGTIATNGHFVSLVQSCPGYNRLLVFDLAGRPLRDIESRHPGYLGEAAFSGNLLTFEGTSVAGTTAYADDLDTGELIALGPAAQRAPPAPRVAGRYVLWYDDTGAHVARLSG
jgi:hypothetical protein